MYRDIGKNQIKSFQYEYNEAIKLGIYLGTSIRYATYLPSITIFPTSNRNYNVYHRKGEPINKTDVFIR